jgi:hypothetical protein
MPVKMELAATFQPNSSRTTAAPASASHAARRPSIERPRATSAHQPAPAMRAAPAKVMNMSSSGLATGTPLACMPPGLTPPKARRSAIMTAAATPTAMRLRT